MAKTQQLDSILLPRQLLSRMFEVQEKWQEFSNELEDFLAASDSRFIERVRQARQEHLNGQVRDFNELKNELLE